MTIRIFHLAAASAAMGLAGLIALPLLDSGVGSTLVAPAAAKGAPAGKRAVSSPSLDALDDALLADRLAAVGERTKDALLLIAAAKIKQRIGESEATRKPASKRSDAAAPKRKGDARRTDVGSLLARAKHYAGGRKDLIALADDVANTRSRGRVGGVSRTEHVIRGRTEFMTSHTFQGGSAAGVAIRGDGDTDLDLFVLDASGRPLCGADGPTDEEICRWRPAGTSEFTIVIRNLGGVSNAYRLWTN